MVRPRLRRFLYVLLIFAVGLFVIWPTIAAFLIRRQITSALQHAQSVRLDEFSRTQVIRSVELPREEWQDVVSAVPVVPDTGIPFLVALCFVPHHRVVVTGAGDSSLVFNVCFGCDQVATDSSGILGTPYLWRSSVRHLFEQHHIPIRSLLDYAAIPQNSIGREAPR